MVDTEDHLRGMLARRAGQTHSTLHIADIRGAEERTGWFRSRLLLPALAAASVAIVVLVIVLLMPVAGRSEPPAGPGPEPTPISQSQTPSTATVTAPLTN